METFLNILNSLVHLLRTADLMPDFVSARGIFCSIAWIATILAVISVVMALFTDFDSGGDADMAPDAPDADSGPFSVRAIIGFLLGLGWGGYISVQNGLSVVAAITVGLLVGIALFVIVAAIIRLMYSMKSDGTLRYEELKGLHGTVYVTIPPNGEPGGQVQIPHPSQFVTMPAIQYGSTPLPAQSSIVVTDATSTLLTVEALPSHQH